MSEHKYWCYDTKKEVPNKRVDAFLNELEQLYRKHNLSIDYDVFSGSFIIQNFTESNLNSMRLSGLMLEGEIK